MGELSHFEIGVPDTQRAREFYGRLFGWDFRADSGNGAYIEAAGVAGGMHPAPEPGVVLFFSVPDIEEAAQRVRELGGEVGPGRAHGPAGTYAFACRDDQGVPFGLHQPAIVQQH